MSKFLFRKWVTLEAAVIRLAAEGMVVTPDDVLHMAALGKIRAYARLREPMSLHATKVVAGPDLLPRLVVTGGGSIVAFVLLNQRDAWRLEAQGEVEVERVCQPADDPLEPFEDPHPEHNWKLDHPFVATKSDVAVLTEEVMGLLMPALASEVTEVAPTRWPWGAHETTFLQHLHAAADRHWGLYDPADFTTAPTNETVIKWLKERGVSDRIASSMATILRANDLPSGPRT